jgi:fumarate hydratase class I
MFHLGADTTKYRKLSAAHVATVTIDGENYLRVSDEAISLLTREAFADVSHFLRASHLAKLGAILKDDEASDNDRFVATELLKNAVVAAKGILPSCQDTGTAIIMGKRGHRVLCSGSEASVITEAVRRVYTERNLRYSQLAPLSMFEERNTKDNTPAQIDLLADTGEAYKFLFMAKGGGSANKTYLYQKTKALLNEESLTRFVEEKLKSLGTAACPPYHIAMVIGGTSAESTLKTVKLASAHYYDGLPTTGDETGRAYRDLAWEKRILTIAQESGIGAQFGGKYFAHDVRVVRLPRHGASCPVGLGVSCSADRQVKGKITSEGVFLEVLERNPEQFLAEATISNDLVPIDLTQSMDAIRKQLSQYPVGTGLALTGEIVVARDIAHAKLKEALDAGQPLPDYIKEKIVYYAGPAKRPDGLPSGSFGPTTAQRMDPYVPVFQAQGGSLISLAKGNRSRIVTDSCKEHRGFYLGSIGGPAAILAANNITKVEVLAFPELGMEAIWRISIKNFPAFIIIDDKGNDFFLDLLR